MATYLTIFICIISTLVSASYQQQNVSCPRGSMQCPNSSRCIPSSFFCDLDNDCGDNSDEPDSCRYRLCGSEEIRCRSGQCIGRAQFCAGLVSCADNSIYVDDNTCQITWCPRGQSKCPTSNRCIRDSWFCDGDNDCGDYSDESRSICIQRSCPDGRVKCNNGQCVNERLFCSGVIRCNDDTTTEDACSTVTCEPGWSKCRTVNSCIMDVWICDGDTDCMDNSDEDEQRCGSSECEHGWVPCPTGSGCLPSTWLCDGDRDCPDGSDESNQICRSRKAKRNLMDILSLDT